MRALLTAARVWCVDRAAEGTWWLRIGGRQPGGLAHRTVPESRRAYVLATRDALVCGRWRALVAADAR